jgi:tryptophan-rich sensory protein
MTEVCNLDTIFNKGDFSSREFLSRAVITAIPLIIGTYYIYNYKEWASHEIITPCWGPSSIVQIVINLIIAVIIAIVWYRMTKICATNKREIDILFGVFLAFAVLTLFVFFGQKDLRAASYFMLFLFVISGIISYYVWSIQKSCSILLILITLWFLYLTVVLFNSYKC